MAVPIRVTADEIERLSTSRGSLAAGTEQPHCDASNAVEVAQSVRYSGSASGFVLGVLVIAFTTAVCSKRATGWFDIVGSEAK